MGINRYDEYVPFKYPIEALLASGKIHEDRIDKGNDAFDKYSALLNTINPMPGHEDYAKTVIDKYHNQAKELVDSGIKPDDPRFLQKTRQMVYGLQADPDVRKIQNSRKYYDEIIAKALPEVRAKSGIVNMPGFFDKQGMPIQNTGNANNFGYFVGDYVGEVDDELSKVAAQVEKNPTHYGAKPDPNMPGMYVVQEDGVTRNWRDSNTFKNTIMSGIHDWANRPQATPARQRYFAEFGDDPAKLFDLYNDRATKYMFDNTQRDRNYSFKDIPNYGQEQNPDDPGFVDVETPVQIQHTGYEDIIKALTYDPGFVAPYKDKQDYFPNRQVPSKPRGYSIDKLSKDKQEMITDLLTEAPKNYSPSEKMDWAKNEIKAAQYRETRGVAKAYVNTEAAKAQSDFMSRNIGTYKTIDDDGEIVSLTQFMKDNDLDNEDLQVSGEYNSTNSFVDIASSKHPTNTSVQENALLFVKPQYITINKKGSALNGKQIPLGMTLGKQNSMQVIEGTNKQMPAQTYFYLKNLLAKSERSGFKIRLDNTLTKQLGLGLTGTVKHEIDQDKDSPTYGKYVYNVNTKDSFGNPLTIKAETEDQVLDALTQK